MADRKETDLAAPVKALFEAHGFTVKSEVNGCDLVAVRNEETALVELKAAFSLELVLQGVQRQRLAESVYLAVEAPRKAGDRWSRIVHLCRRLGLGLIAVSFGRREPAAQVVCDPVPWAPRQDSKGRMRMLAEFHRRSGDHNTAGSVRLPLVTAYRENALRVARTLAQGPASVKAVRVAAGLANAGAILHDNVYGWFARVKRGTYSLTESGLKAMETYADVLAQL